MADVRVFVMELIADEIPIEGTADEISMDGTSDEVAGGAVLVLRDAKGSTVGGNEEVGSVVVDGDCRRHRRV